LVISGTPAPIQPSSIAVDNAARLPRSTYLERPDLDHFGPMVRPDVVAELIADFLAEH
jgi:pimeloyl-ACP methyl ester carboxylesterase